MKKIDKGLKRETFVEKTSSDQGVPNEIVFHNRQALGDVLTMTCGIRDFKRAFPDTRVGVITTAVHIWDNNPYVDVSFKDQDKMLKIGPGFLTNKSNSSNLHMCNAFRRDIENKLYIQIPQGDIRPDIWLTKEEYERKPLIEGPYWIIIIGGEPGWTAKMYPVDRWQKVVDSLPKIKFVQLGLKNHPFPKLNNVIDFVGKTEDKETGLRDLFSLFLHAQGSIGLVSFHMHLSAAFNNPCVVVAGAREPSWFTHYMGHQYLQTNGTLPCGETKACWKCDVKGCPDQVKGVPRCVDIIKASEVTNAVRRYYDGGRLKYGEKVKNPFFKNITREKKIFVITKKEKGDVSVLPKELEELGFHWGQGSIDRGDWALLKDKISKYSVKTILEFGTGLSTLLMMNESIDKLVVYETDLEWINKMKSSVNDKVDIRHWDGKTIKEELLKFDFCFVDGPSGSASREFSIKTASEVANVIVVHDAARPSPREHKESGKDGEVQFQEKYIKDKFRRVATGGRAWVWERKDTGLKIAADLNAPVARMVTTCRGWGGSERSSIHIVQMLLDRGYRVELIPTGNICGEYGNHIPEAVRIREWKDLVYHTNLLILYTSDTIWNYNKPQYIDYFPGIDTDRKVMVLNYQLGEAGKAEWTKGWDKYLFLNSTKEWEFKQRYPEVSTRVLPPPTDLSKFFEVEINYDNNLRLIRHSAQGDAKHPEYTNKMIRDVLKIKPDTEFYYMPARSNTMERSWVHKFGRNEIPLPEFLAQGNLFWYHLPPGYQDQGPRVIMEAMAAGLAVIADNNYGAKDRITPLSGWLCDSYDDYLVNIKDINSEILEEKGKGARELARSVFRPERWVEEICENS